MYCPLYDLGSIFVDFLGAPRNTHVKNVVRRLPLTPLFHENAILSKLCKDLFVGGRNCQSATSCRFPTAKTAREASKWPRMATPSHQPREAAKRHALCHGVGHGHNLSVPGRTNGESGLQMA